MEKVLRLGQAGDVADLFGVDPKTIARWANEGKIPVHSRTLGEHRRFDLDVIEPMARAHRGNGGQP